jgi:3-oxoadipate enol-lactonase
MSTIEVNGLKIAYDDVGEGPEVVLIHGYPFNRSLWKPQVAALQTHNRVIALDLRGLGDSDLTGTVASMNSMAQDIALLLDHLGVGAAVIGGLSMGGYVTLAFYRAFQPRVRGLILADTRPQADSDEGKRMREEQATQILAEGMNKTAENMLPKLLHPDTATKRPGVAAHVREMILTTNPAGAAAALLGMASRDDQTSLLQSIDIPTLILVGEKDAITPVADSENMQRHIDGSRLVIIQEAGHVSNLEQPDRFNREVIDFLSANGLR